jgi:hypothetical protein
MHVLGDHQGFLQSPFIQGVRSNPAAAEAGRKSSAGPLQQVEERLQSSPGVAIKTQHGCNNIWQWHEFLTDAQGRTSHAQQRDRGEGCVGGLMASCGRAGKCVRGWRMAGLVGEKGGEGWQTQTSNSDR